MRLRPFTVGGRDHLADSEVRRQIAGRPKGTVVLQPENKETGPGLLLPLRGVLWSDWGSEQRIMNILEKRGHLGRLSRVQDNRNLEAVGLSGI
jgi:hypothetical protein